jgi:ABC-type nickel/cobalt efflux system permease component RcnA
LGHSCGCGEHHCPKHEAGKELVTLEATGSKPESTKQTNPESIIPAAKHSFRTTALLGVAVGMLPCPSALAAFFAGLSTGSPTSGYLIVLLFGAGIGFSLTVVGLLLQYFGESISHKTNRYAHLPWAMFRGCVILAIGVFYVGRLCF